MTNPPAEPRRRFRVRLLLHRPVIIGPGITGGAAYAIVFLFVLTLLLAAANLLFTTRAVDTQAAATSQCQFHAVQRFDAAIQARSHASSAASSALQHLIIVVFTQRGTRAQVRAADLAAYAHWRAALAAQQRIQLPPLPETACG